MGMCVLDLIIPFNAIISNVYNFTAMFYLEFS